MGQASLAGSWPRFSPDIRPDDRLESDSGRHLVRVSSRPEAYGMMDTGSLSTECCYLCMQEITLCRRSEVHTYLPNLPPYLEARPRKPQASSSLIERTRGLLLRLGAVLPLPDSQFSSTVHRQRQAQTWRHVH